VIKLRCTFVISALPRNLICTFLFKYRAISKAHQILPSNFLQHFIHQVFTPFSSSNKAITASIATREAAMTLIPADTKDAKGPQGPSMPTMNFYPNPILEPEVNAHDLPPYTETDTSPQNREVPPRQAPAPIPNQKVPESNSISANSEVHITEPLHVLGYA
jgi:hypothetical protein